MVSMESSREIDVAAARRDTPGCDERIHLNNAGASLMPRCVLGAVVDHLELESRIGGYEAATAARERIDAVYESAARLVNCRDGEIALLENATRAWDAVFYGLRLERGDRIFTGRAEYCSNFMAYLDVADRTGAEIVVIDDDEHGQIDVAQLAAEIDERAKLISLSHIPTSGGLVNPAEAVGRVARAAGVPFLLDACQSVGQLPIDVQAIGCDFLSATGRKFLRAPRGTGFLYVADRSLDLLRPPMVEVGGADWTALGTYTLKPGARRFETWEASYALQLGLGRAIDYALELGVDLIWARVSALADALRTRLTAIAGVTVRDLGLVRCGIVTFEVDGVRADEVASRLAQRGINVYVSTIEDTRLDFEQRGLERVVRASVHYFNTERELDALCEAVAARRPRTGEVTPRRRSC
jgi:cysteine desulfurase/selenocysteine lyase